jgi:hypothetical protein
VQIEENALRADGVLQKPGDPLIRGLQQKIAVQRPLQRSCLLADFREARKQRARAQNDDATRHAQRPNRGNEVAQ